MRHTFTLALTVFLLLFISCTKESTEDETTDYVYSDSVLYGPNILIKDLTIYNGVDFGLLAFVPSNGNLIVKITKLNGGNWKVVSSTINNWALSQYDGVTNSQTFTSIEANHWCHLRLEIPYGKFRLEYYEEDDETPSYSKEIEVN